MTKHVIIFFMFSVISLFAFSAPERIVLSNQGAGVIDDRSHPLCFDMPDAFYNHDVKTQEIIIDGGGAVSYYDVEISSPVTNMVELSTQVDGTYDTFDISSLATGSHVITIESPSGNTYEGTFTTY